jgi:DNA uptake protein ComE-like DNA-binding protein
MQYNDQPIPTVGLDKELEQLIRIMNLTQSVASLEKLQDERKTGALEHTFPAELIGLIQRNWRKMGNPYLQLVNCKKVLAINAVHEVLSNVRNSLLDFMLKIDGEFGSLTEIEELKTKQKEISTIMNQTIINNTGDGNVVNTGENAEIKATININKGDVSELIKQLKNIGIDEVDAVQLVEIIDTEEPNYEKKTFGVKVNEWTQKMLGKALDGTWDIGIGAAGSLLAEALKMYYGM